MPIRRATIAGVAGLAVCLVLLLIAGVATSRTLAKAPTLAQLSVTRASAASARHPVVRPPLLRPTLVPAGWTSAGATLTSGGIRRHYLVIRPPTGVNGVLPVVVVLPGRGLDPVEIERMTRLIPIVGKAIMVYPAGVGRSWNAGACCGLAHARGVDDVAFLDALIRHVVATEPGASRQEVYLIGFSNGGRMAYRVACESPDLVAGVAAVEAVPVFACRRLDPTPVVIVAQRDDPLLSVAAGAKAKTVQGYVEPTVDATVGRWLALDGCVRDASLTAAGSARVSTYHRCRGGGRLEYVLYAGGRHDWPDGNARTPSAGRLIWAFFRRGGLPVLVHQSSGTGPQWTHGARRVG